MNYTSSPDSSMSDAEEDGHSVGALPLISCLPHNIRALQEMPQPIESGKPRGRRRKVPGERTPSPSQKLKNRKEMNKIAAQGSRARKKQYTDALEKRVQELIRLNQTFEERILAMERERQSMGLPRMPPLQLQLNELKEDYEPRAQQGPKKRSKASSSSQSSAASSIMSSPQCSPSRRPSKPSPCLVGPQDRQETPMVGIPSNISYPGMEEKTVVNVSVCNSSNDSSAVQSHQQNLLQAKRPSLSSPVSLQSMILLLLVSCSQAQTAFAHSSQTTMPSGLTSSIQTLTDFPAIPIGFDSRRRDDWLRVAAAPPAVAVGT